MPQSPRNWAAQSSLCFKLENCGNVAGIASNPTIIRMWPTLASMPEEGVPMDDYRAPSPDDLNKFVVLIRFLGQVHTLMQDINEEAERFNGLLDQQCEVLNEHRQDIEDLTSALSDYENEMERVKSIDLPKQRNNL